MSQPAPISVPKGYQRLGAFPLDASSVFATLAELQTYASTNGTAYAGQVCAVSGTGKVYVLQSDKSLLELGAGGGGGGGGVSSWNDLTDKPTEFPPEAHTHQISDINMLAEGLNDKAPKETPIFAEQVTVRDYVNNEARLTPEKLYGTVFEFNWYYGRFDMIGTVGPWAGVRFPVLDWNTNSELSVEGRTIKNLGAPVDPNDAVRLQDLTGGPAFSWNDLTDKPTEFPPEAHTHSWNDISDKPSVFQPESHTHEIEQINGLTEQLQSVDLTWDNIENKPESFPPQSHQHELADIIDLGNLADVYIPLQGGQPFSVGQGQVLTWSGSQWLPSDPLTSYLDLHDLPTLGTAAATDATDYATATQGAKADTSIQRNTGATTANETLVNAIRALTQSEYDALTPKDSNTIYFIKQ